MNNTKQLVYQEGILFLRDTTIDIYVPSTAHVISMQLLPTFYTDMELISEDGALEYISNYFTLNKIPPSRFFLLTSGPLFKKEIVFAPTDLFEQNINSYLDYIPFDTVLSKRISSENGAVIVAGNGDLYQSFQRIFQKMGSVIECVTPLFNLDPQINEITTLTVPAAEYLLKKTFMLKQESFNAAPQKTASEFEIVEHEPIKSQEKSSLPLLIGVFVVLLAVLAYVYVQSVKLISPPAKSAIAPTNLAPQFIPTVTLPSTSSASLSSTTIKISAALS
ncbi:hypothetical protein COY90_00490, partial [Candidatus Roizmanbacteria bacterium CG_4_10_14_0_8_um_filter_39_9]